MENKLTQEDSLALITKMISTAKGNITQGSFHMLLWGWVTITVSISHFLLATFKVIKHPEMVWLLMVPTLVVSMAVGYTKGRKNSFSTHLDGIYMWIWLALTINMSLMIYYLNGKWDIISSMVLIMAGYATFLSGKLIKFKPMIYGGIAFWLWSLVAYFAGSYYGLLITAGAIFTGYVIPGLMLRKRKNEL